MICDVPEWTRISDLRNGSVLKSVTHAQHSYHTSRRSTIDSGKRGAGTPLLEWTQMLNMPAHGFMSPSGISAGIVGSCMSDSFQRLSHSIYCTTARSYRADEIRHRPWLRARCVHAQTVHSHTRRYTSAIKEFRNPDKSNNGPQKPDTGLRWNSRLFRPGSRQESF